MTDLSQLQAELTARADMFRVMADGLLANGLYAADGGDAFIATLRTVMQALLTKGCEIPPPCAQRGEVSASPSGRR